jgi:hypothetical protein
LLYQKILQECNKILIIINSRYYNVQGILDITYIFKNCNFSLKLGCFKLLVWRKLIFGGRTQNGLRRPTQQFGAERTVERHWAFVKSQGNPRAGVEDGFGMGAPDRLRFVLGGQLIDRQHHRRHSGLRDALDRFRLGGNGIAEGPGRHHRNTARRTLDHVPGQALALRGRELVHFTREANAKEADDPAGDIPVGQRVHPGPVGLPSARNGVSITGQTPRTGSSNVLITMVLSVEEVSLMPNSPDALRVPGISSGWCPLD